MSRVPRHSEGAMVELDCTRAHGSVVKGPSELQLEERDGAGRGKCVRRGEEGEGELTDRSPSLRSPWLQVVSDWDRSVGRGYWKREGESVERTKVRKV